MSSGRITGSRTRILANVCIAIMVIFIGRLFQLQIIEHGKYVALADQEQMKHLVIPAKRGEIYMKDSDKLAKVVLNEQVYTVAADPQTVADPARVAKLVRETVGGTARTGLENLLANKDVRYQVLATQVTRKQAEILKKHELQGVSFQETTRRVYPEGKLAAQTLGFVNGEGQGQYGIEGGINERLEGEDGMLHSVTDISNVPLTIGDKNISQPARDGDDVVLTVDRNIQAYAEEALAKGLRKAGATKGSVVVMDPKTSNILAMANLPTYSPAAFTKVADASLFNNDIISSPYEPASVIKLFTVTAGIDKGVITPQSTYYNTDTIKVYDTPIRNALTGLTGVRTMQDVLDNSLNTGTVTIAQRLGDGTNINRQARETMYEYFHNKFGLGEKTGIELAGEARGIVISPKEQEGNAVRYSNMTFGQGLDVTMLQVATGYCAMVNGGNYRPPTIIAGTVAADGALKSEKGAAARQIISKETSATMRKMSRDARRSVSYMRDADKRDYTIGGKTGTAETLQDGDYTKSQTVGTYLGFGGANEPEYVIMVQVSAPGKNLEGGIHASPIFTDISNWLLDYMKIQPKG